MLEVLFYATSDSLFLELLRKIGKGRARLSIGGRHVHLMQNCINVSTHRRARRMLPRMVKLEYVPSALGGNVDREPENSLDV